MDICIYKVESTYEKFREVLLSDYGLDQIGDEIKRKLDRKIAKNEFKSDLKLTFYYKNTITRQEVEWATLWGNFFSSDEGFFKRIESAYGIVLVEIDEKFLYCISYGRGHHYAERIADRNFGLDMAEILLKIDDIKVKSAKYYKKSKNKAVIQYNLNSFVTTEIGESDEFVSGHFTLSRKYSKFKLNKYKEISKYGTAMKILAQDYSPREIVELIYEVHLIYSLEYSNRNSKLPRLIFVKENQDTEYLRSNLDKLLLENILDTDDYEVSISYLTERNGDMILSRDEEVIYEIIYDRKKSQIKLDINSIRSFLIEHNCSNIDRVSIRPLGDANQAQSLKEIIDIALNHNAKNYCLFKGKWASFNDSYIEFIEKEILKVNEISFVDENYDLTSSKLKYGRNMMIKNDKYDKGIKYKEYPYNIWIENQNKSVLLDRERLHELFTNVEFADIYDPNEESLIHVKIGDSKDIRYCIQQSARGAEIFNRHDSVLSVYGIDSVKKIVMLLVLDTKNLFKSSGKIDFSASKSIYLKVELIEWLNIVRSLNFEPKIIIARNRAK